MNTELLQKLREKYEASPLSRLSSNEWLVLIVSLCVVLSDYWLGAFVCAAGVLALIRKQSLQAMRRQDNAIPALIMLPLMLLPALLSGNTMGLIAGAVGWLTIVYMVFGASIMSERFFDIICDALLFVSAAAALCSVICLLAGITVHGDRIQSIFENPNYYGSAIEVFVLVAVFRFIKTKKPLYIALAVINALCNIFADCRTAWLAIAASLFVLLVFYFRKWWLFPAVVALAVGCFFVARQLPVIGDRLTWASLSFALEDRLTLWKNAWGWFLERPLFGWGTMGYRYLSEQAGLPVKAHCHNLVLNLLLDYGVAGALGFVSLALSSVTSIFKKRSTKADALLPSLLAAVLTATLVHGIMDVPVLGVSTSLLLVTVLSGNGIKLKENADER